MPVGVSFPLGASFARNTSHKRYREQELPPTRGIGSRSSLSQELGNREQELPLTGIEESGAGAHSYRGNRAQELPPTGEIGRRHLPLTAEIVSWSSLSQRNLPHTGDLVMILPPFNKVLIELP